MGAVGSALTNFRWAGYKCRLGCDIMYPYDTWCCRLYNLVSGKLNYYTMAIFSNEALRSAIWTLSQDNNEYGIKIRLSDAAKEYFENIDYDAEEFMIGNSFEIDVELDDLSEACILIYVASIGSTPEPVITYLGESTLGHLGLPRWALTDERATFRYIRQLSMCEREKDVWDLYTSRSTYIKDLSDLASYIIGIPDYLGIGSDNNLVSRDRIVRLFDYIHND